VWLSNGLTPWSARRLMLCARTCAVMETGLRLLGIEPVERM
jgi:arginyl-tRNA synthetase